MGQLLTEDLRGVQKLQKVSPTLGLVGGKPSVGVSQAQQLKPAREGPENPCKARSRGAAQTLGGPEQWALCQPGTLGPPGIPSQHTHAYHL